MALTLSKEALKESLTADKAGAALTKIQDARVFKQMGTLLMIAGAVALGLFVFFWSQKPAYTPLYTGLDAKATAEATDMLRAAQIPFQLDQATGAISVPEANLHDARLKLAGAGLAESGRLGFEMMERDPGFGVSQFVENARYQHALETELVRTITTLRPVRDARVHLAIPKPSAFTRQREVASASVVLDLRSGAMLERNQVDAIVHLVSSSIPRPGARTRHRGRPERPHAHHQRSEQRGRAQCRPVRARAQAGDLLQRPHPRTAGTADRSRPRECRSRRGHGFLGHRGSPRDLRQRSGQDPQ